MKNEEFLENISEYPVNRLKKKASKRSVRRNTPQFPSGDYTSILTTMAICQEWNQTMMI